MSNNWITAPDYSVQLQNYYQVVRKPTRGRNTLDKCYINVKNSHTQCQQLAKLSNSDHFVMHLVPAYKPPSMEKPPYKNCREFSDEYIGNLQACFDTTLLHNLLSDTENIYEQTSVISDNINFFTHLCIPVKKKKVYQNDKPWLKG